MQGEGLAGLVDLGQVAWVDHLVLDCTRVKVQVVSLEPALLVLPLFLL